MRGWWRVCVVCAADMDISVTPTFRHGGVVYVTLKRTLTVASVLMYYSCHVR